MTKNKLWTGLALGLLLAGCSNEEIFQISSDTGILTAVMEDVAVDTRVGFTDGEAKFFWTENDEIGVTTNASPNIFQKMTLSTGQGQGTGTFGGSVSGTPEGYAVYPYVKSYNHTLKDGTLTYTFPAEYEYETLDAEYGKTDGTGNSFNAPMWAEVKDLKAWFKHLGGVFAIYVDELPTDVALKFVLTTPENKLTGVFEATLTETEPKLSTSTEGVSEENNHVTIRVAKPTSGGASTISGYFYVPAPTGTYSQILATVYAVSDDGKETELVNGAWENKTIDRRTILRGNIEGQIVTGGESVQVSNVTDVADALKSNPAVTVESISGNSNTITLPATTHADTPISISFAAVNGNDAALTINQNANETVANNVTLSVPQDASNTMDLVIDLPNSTVTLAPNAKTATYDNVTSTTADNTLIVADGVTINTLNVKQGNVRAKNGSTISAVTKDAGATGNITLYYEGGANIPQSLPEGVVAVNAEIIDLKAVFAEGGTYQLQSDIDIQGQSLTVANGVNTTLDLNGHTITANNSGTGNIRVLGSFTLRDRQGNGKITAAQDYSGTYSSGLIYISGENAKMTMESGSIYAVREDASNKGQFGVGVYDGGAFTMTGGKIEAGWYAVSGNGNDKTTKSIIKIQGGELISTADYAIYLPHSGETIISGGTINGAAGGICVQRGTLAISDNADIRSLGTGDTGDWGDGTGNLGNSALNIAAEYGDCTVTMTGGKLTAEKDALIVKGESAHSISVSISGGTFSDPSALGYLTKGANVKVELAKDYEGPGLGIFKNGNGDSATVEIDMANHTWTLNDQPLFGSPGTVSQYFHLEKDATVTFKNGTLKPLNDASGKMLIQNYCYLTLENVIVEGGSTCEYVISNNNGSCTLTGSTVTAAEDNCAFDVYSFSSYEGVTVTVNVGSTITGRVEFGGNNNQQNGKLVVNGGTFNGDLVVTEAYYNAEDPNIILNGGTFNGNGWDSYQTTAQE